MFDKQLKTVNLDKNVTKRNNTDQDKTVRVKRRATPLKVRDSRSYLNKYTTIFDSFLLL